MSRYGLAFSDGYNGILPLVNQSRNGETQTYATDFAHSRYERKEFV